MLVVENVDFGGWSTGYPNPARRTTGTTNPGDAPDNLLYGSGGGNRIHDPWLTVNVGGTVSVTNDTAVGNCNNSAIYNWNSSTNDDPTLTIANCNSNHTNVSAGLNNDGDTSNDVRLDKWDYDFSKAYAKKNNIKKTFQCRRSHLPRNLKLSPQ